MSNSLVQGVTTKVLGKAYVEQLIVEADNAVRTSKEALAAAKTGTLTTRTDNNTGVLTMSSGHGITTGARLDIYWTVAGVEYARRGMAVGTVSTNSVPIDLGGGDNLPAADTAIRAMVPVAEAVVVTGDNVVGLVAFSKRAALVTFTDASDVELHAYHLTGDGYAKTWNSASGVTNPLAGDSLAKVYISHGYSAGTADVETVVAYN